MRRGWNVYGCMGEGRGKCTRGDRRKLETLRASVHWTDSGTAEAASPVLIRKPDNHDSMVL